ncbi:MAG: hypothetical protein LUQ65_00260 [Candidatus Helarchaeota archaeon]|nr:hypothetical protein [Candidatus Helarchaeota archaeon]
MKPKLNRIIAREGLIVITLIFLGGISFLLDLRLSSHKRIYEANVQEIEPFIPGDKESKYGGRYLSISPQGIILRFPKNTNHDVIKQTIRRDFPNIKGDDWIIFDSPKGENINASYDEKGNRVFNSIIYKIGWSYVYLFFLIFAYPLYIIIRFVIWAIETLKERKEIDV